MSANNFRPRKFEDFEIIDENEKAVGHVRVKPSGIVWAPVNSHPWYGITLATFATYLEANGTPQKK